MAVVGLVVGVPVSALFLWLAVRDASLDSVWTAARGADPAPLALAIVALGTLYLLQGVRWHRIAAVPRPGDLGFAKMVVGSVACNNVLPGRIGELFRARWLAVAAPMPSGRAVATVGLDRGSDVIALLGFLVLALPFVAAGEWAMRIVVGGALVVVVLVGIVAATRGYVGLRRRDRRERGWLRRIVRDLVDTLAEPFERRRSASVLGLSAAAWGAFAVAVWLIGRSIGVDLGLLECMFVTGILNLGVAIPSSPGFVGTYQWLSVAALAVFGVAHEEALAFSILLQASWYLPTTLIGGYLALFRLDWGL